MDIIETVFSNELIRLIGAPPAWFASLFWGAVIILVYAYIGRHIDKQLKAIGKALRALAVDLSDWNKARARRRNQQKRNPPRRSKRKMRGIANSVFIGLLAGAVCATISYLLH